MDEPPKRRGRPPGSPNKIRRPKPKSARVESRKREAAAKKPATPKRPKPPVHEVQAEICLPGEEFGSRPAREDDSDAPNGQWSLVFPRPRGRPKGVGALLKCDEVTLHKIWDVGIRQCTVYQLAVALGVSRETLGRFFNDNPIAREVFDDAKQAGEGSLKAELFRQALDNNTPALLFCAKHYLGMNDKPRDAGDPATKLKEALSEFGAAISEKYLAFMDEEKAG